MATKKQSGARTKFTKAARADGGNVSRLWVLGCRDSAS
jgi:hypothetical protein